MTLRSSDDPDSGPALSVALESEIRRQTRRFEVGDFTRPEGGPLAGTAGSKRAHNFGGGGPKSATKETDRRGPVRVAMGGQAEATTENLYDVPEDGKAETAQGEVALDVARWRFARHRSRRNPCFRILAKDRLRPRLHRQCCLYRKPSWPPVL